MRWLGAAMLAAVAALLGARFERGLWLDRLGALSDALSERDCERCDDGDLDLLDKLCAVQERIPSSLYTPSRLRQRQWGHGHEPN